MIFHYDDGAFICVGVGSFETFAAVTIEICFLQDCHSLKELTCKTFSRNVVITCIGGEKQLTF